MTDRVFDIAIIGGGPTGLFGLFYTCVREMDAVLIDSLPELGGQLTALYPEKDVFEMPGDPQVQAKRLVDEFVKQATMHREQTIILGERVEGCRQIGSDEPIFELMTNTERKVRARTVLITTGAGAFEPNKLPLDEIAKHEGRFVHYSVRNKAVFEGKKLLIVGGGDSAFDWILSLVNVAESIALVHRRDAFRAHEDSVRKVMAMENVPKYLFYEIKDFVVDDDDNLKQVVLENNTNGERLTLDADIIVASLGFAADAGPVKNWGLEFKANSIVVNQRMETNIKGIYAAGDVAWYDGKLKLIALGVAEAAIAVNAAKHYINPKEREQPVHSTTLFAKKKKTDK